MELKLLFIIISIVSFCFIVFQLYEFICNYEFIIDFNEKYKNYEFTSSPSYTYTDYSIFDPNDFANNTSQKWKCVQYYNNSYYALSEKGIIIKNGELNRFNDEMTCIDYIFSKTILNYQNPCVFDESGSLCTFLKNNMDK